MQYHNIPIIDLQHWHQGDRHHRLSLANQLGDICHQTGFFYLVNHGISDDVIAHYFAELKRFFALPLAKKQAIDKCHSRHFRGWEQLGSELTNNKVDYREQIDIGPERSVVENPVRYYHQLIGPNQWPDPVLLPNFRDTVMDFQQRLGAVAREVLAIMSLSLGLTIDHMDNVFGGKPSPYLKLIRYPFTPDAYQGVGEHKDSGYLTLLLQDKQSGLEAKSTDGNWYAIPPLENSLVVNIGELMQMMTCNYFIAAPHRVSNHGNGERYSSAFFYSPDLDTPLDSITLPAALASKVATSPYHRNAGFMASRTEISNGIGTMNSQVIPKVFGIKYWERWIRSYPDIARKYYPEHFLENSAENSK